MSVLHRTSVGLAWGQTGRVIEIGLNLAFSVVVVRQLGDQGYGTYALLFSLIGLASLLSSLGLNEAMGKYVPKAAAHGGQPEVAELVRSFLIRRLAFTVVASAILYLLSGLLATIFDNQAIDDYVLLVITVFVLQNTGDLLAAYYISSLRVRTYYLVRLIAQSVSLILTVAFFRFWGTRVELVFAAMVVSGGVALLLYLGGLRTDLKSAVKQNPLSQAYRFALTIWTINVLTFGLANQIDTLFIGYFLKDEVQIAQYNVSALVVSKLFMVLTGWSLVVLPSLSEVFARRGLEGLANASSLYFKLHFAVLAPVIMFVAWHAHALIGLVFGTAYEPSAPLLTTYALLSLASVYVFAGPALNVLYAAGGEKFVLWLRVFFGVLNVGLDIILVPRAGALGAVVATGTSVLFASLAELIVARTLVPFRYPFEFVLKVTLAVGLAMLATMWLGGSNWLTLSLSGTLYVMICAGLLYVLKPLVATDRELAQLTHRWIGTVTSRFSTGR